MTKWVFTLACAVFSLATAVAMTFGAVAYADYATELTWGAIVFAAIALVCMLLTFRSMFGGEDAAAMGDTYNNSGNNFGHMGPINYGRGQRTLSASDKDQLAANLPRATPIEVRCAWGDQEAFTLATEIHNYLTGAGFTVNEGVNHAMGSEPMKGLQVITDTDPVLIRVGSNIR